MSDPRQPVVFRYYDGKLGVHQISPFPEDNTPFLDVDPLMSRSRFITVIEVFGQILFLAFIDLGEQKLADQAIQTALDWEHAVANNNSLMDPNDFTKITNPVRQAIIDDLEQQTEDFQAQANALFVARPNVTKRILAEMDERREKE